MIEWTKREKVIEQEARQLAQNVEDLLYMVEKEVM
jgi:hypothetical protein